MITFVAFGRFSMSNEPPKISRPEPKVAADAVLALAFGIGGEGAANRVLAKIAARISRDYRIPLICQTEIARYLEQEPETGLFVIPHSPRRQDTWDAVEIARDQFCEPNHWKNLVLVCHPDHRNRAAAVMREYGLTAHPDEIGSVPYDPKSEEWWTKGPIPFSIGSLLAWIRFEYFSMTRRGRQKAEGRDRRSSVKALNR